MELKELQLIEYNLLKDLVEILNRNGIRYWLAYGTCLGAARHNGFIPWDDDVDIYIHGEDYPKLQSIFMTQNTGYLELHDYSIKKGYPYVFPKVVNRNTKLKEKLFANINYECGVYIDVFPLFEISDYKFIRFFQYKRRLFYRMVIDAHYRDLKHFRILSIFLRHCFDTEKIQSKLYHIYTRKHKNKEYLGEPLQYGDNTKIAKLHKKYNFEKNNILKFEGKEFSVPYDYNSYLTDQYGDWMTPPPESKRKTEHRFEYIDLNKEST